jgi:crotonobetaine/carnitine-CoA ligase
VPASLHRDFEEYFGLKLFEAYGFSEAGIVAFNRDRRVGSFGRPVSEHFEIALLDEEDNPVERGRPGMLAIRPRIPYSMFSGYLGMPDYTLGTLRNLWFHTGDLVIEDADGYLSFVRRDSDAIRRRGENISPQDVERAVTEVPGVLECAAYGVPSELTEEEVMVAVVRDSQHAALTAERIAGHCEQALPRFAVPRFIRFVDVIPKNDSQKALRRALKAEGVTPDTWERATR